MSGVNGAHSSYEEMYDEQYQKVYGYIRRKISDDVVAVEDLTQEVFLLAFVKWDTLRYHPNIPGFLMKTAKNKIMKWYGSQSRVSVSDEEVMDYVSQNEKNMGNVDEFCMVDFYAAAEDILLEKDLTVLRQYYEYGYTSSELAKKLGITESCLKIRIARMKEKLRKGMAVFVLFTIFLV